MAQIRDVVEFLNSKGVFPLTQVKRDGSPNLDNAKCMALAALTVCIAARHSGYPVVSFTKQEISSLFSVPSENAQLTEVLKQYLRLGIADYEPTHNGNSYEYRPLTTQELKTPLYVPLGSKNDFKWETSSGWVLIQSPRRPIMSIEHPGAPNEHNLQKGPYLLMSFNTDGFENLRGKLSQSIPINSLQFIACASMDYNAPNLRNTWLAINKVKSVPPEIGDLMAFEFWNTVDCNYFIKNGCFEPNSSLTPIWGKLRSGFWRPGTAKEQRRTLINEVERKAAQGVPLYFDLGFEKRHYVKKIKPKIIDATAPKVEKVQVVEEDKTTQNIQRGTTLPPIEKVFSKRNPEAPGGIQEQPLQKFAEEIIKEVKDVQTNTPKVKIVKNVTFESGKVKFFKTYSQLEDRKPITNEAILQDMRQRGIMVAENSTIEWTVTDKGDYLKADGIVIEPGGVVGFNDENHEPEVNKEPEANKEPVKVEEPTKVEEPVKAEELATVEEPVKVEKFNKVVRLTKVEVPEPKSYEPRALNKPNDEPLDMVLIARTILSMEPMLRKQYTKAAARRTMNFLLEAAAEKVINSRK